MDEFFIVAARRSDGQTPKLVKAVENRIYYDEIHARRAAEHWSELLGCPMDVFRFVAEPKGA